MNEQPSTPAPATATLAGGCFWCLEAVYDELEGVIEVESGYAGGKIANPTYQQVCTGSTGHAEVVQITFDPGVISFRELLEVFFSIHDPTTLNRQGNDVGTQYRSAIFYHTPEQKQIAEQVIAELDAAKAWPNRIVTEVAPLRPTPRPRLTTRSISSTTPISPIARSSSRPNWRSSERSTQSG